MKKIIVIFIFIFGIHGMKAQESFKNFIDQNYIEVTGTAEMEIIPDQIQITISVSERDFKNQQAFFDFEKQVTGKLKEIGISLSDELSVMKMNSSLKSSFIGKDNMFSTRQYMVIVHNTEKANEVFDEMEKIGISTIAVTRFDHSEIEKFRLQVKINSIKAAKDKAQALTTAIGQNIGRALYINEINNNSYLPNVYSNVMVKNNLQSDAAEINEVNFQKIKLSYSVLVRFELK